MRNEEPGTDKMAATYGSGGQSPTSISRTLERVFDDAQLTGEIHLAGRNLKDYPKIATKYDLADTVVADFTKNRLTEVPSEIAEFTSMERLNCYHNVIRSIPDSLVQLQVLTYLNLSRNQLTTLSPCICQLQALEVLLANNNKLVSLPQEIWNLEKLMELDVSCNEITHLPLEIGKLLSLRSLNVRKNLLIEIPSEISKLNLRKLDFSANKISTIPTIFRVITTLEEMIIDHNPLVSPPANICTKGKEHIMKYLVKESKKEDRKKAVLTESEKWSCRKSFPQQPVTSEEFKNLSPELRWKRHTVSSDSGYIEESDKSCWSLAEADSDLDEAKSLALKAAEAVKEHRQGREAELQWKIAVEASRVPLLECQEPIQSPPTPVNVEDTFTRELQRQKADYERRKKMAEQLRLQQEDEEREERRRTALKLQEEQRMLMERQREEARRQEEESKRREEEEARRAEEEARRLEEEVRKQEEITKRQEEMIKHKVENNYLQPSLLTFSDGYPGYDESMECESMVYRKCALGFRSSKEEKKLCSSTQYRRTVSDSVKMRKQDSSSQNVPVNHVQKKCVRGVPDENMNPSTSPAASSTPSRSSSTSSISTTSPYSNQMPSPTTVKSTSKLRSDRQTLQSSSHMARKTRPTMDKPAAGVGDKHARTTGTVASRSMTSGKANHVTPEEEFRIKHEAMMNQRKHEAQVLKRRLEDHRSKVTTKETIQSHVSKQRSPGESSVNSSHSSTTTTSRISKTGKVGGPTKITAGRRSTKTTEPEEAWKMFEEFKDADPNFTIRRQHNHVQGEMEQIENLRLTIEQRLKVTLPENLPEALKDGVVLCHLVNQIRPRAVVSIHVPSPAVPQLTMAKCRRNVENFLDACRKVGVDQLRICSAHDILEEKGIARVAVTVSALVSNPKQAVA